MSARFVHLQFRNRSRNLEQLEVRSLLAADFLAADLNSDNLVDAQDIELLSAEVRNQNANLE